MARVDLMFTSFTASKLLVQPAEQHGLLLSQLADAAIMDHRTTAASAACMSIMLSK
jgi:hypothetical protein